MPFWWVYPKRIRRYFIDRWRRFFPSDAWTPMIEETTVLSRSDLKHLFPEATVLLNNFRESPKSYIAYSRAQSKRAYIDLSDKA
jgi:hypothetical protein